MSESIDRRVVEMAFDAKDFLQNVGTTLGALDKLNQALNFKNSTKGFKDVADAARNTNLSGLGGAVDTIQAKFSALQVIATTALANITNQAVNAGKRLISAFTIDPIKTGFQEYETQINAVQTILANTASKGTNLEQVNKALDELNHYADKTIYNFTEMTRNIGTFTAAGIDLDTSVSAIQGIANLAAVSGSNAQQASTAMYQLSQALASGTVKLQDWNSVVNAGMGGEVFQNALKETARLHGVAVDAMIKKNGSFRESLREGWITSEILTETLKKFTTSGVNEYLADNSKLSKKQIEQMREAADVSKDWEAAYHDIADTIAKNSDLTADQVFEYLKMSKTAEDAATKVKTFTQLLDTLKEAVQSGWTQTWEILIGDFNEAKGLFTGISDSLSKVINASADSRNKVLQTWKDLGGRKDIINGVTTAFGALRDAYKNAFPEKTTKQLETIGQKIKDITAGFAEHMKVFKLHQDAFTDIFKAVGDVVGLVKDAFAGLFDVLNGGGGESALENILFTFVDLVAFISRGISALIEFGRESGVFKIVHGLLMGINDILVGLIDTAYMFADSLTDAIDKIPAPVVHLGDTLDKAFSVFDEKKVKVIDVATNAIGNLFSLIGKFISHVDLGDIGQVLAGSGILMAGKKLSDMLGSLQIKFDDILKLPKSLGSIKKTFQGLSDTLNEFTGTLRTAKFLGVASALAVLAYSCVQLSKVPIDKLGKALGAIATLFGELAGASWLVKGNTAKGLITLSFAIVVLSKAVKTLSEVGDIGNGLVGVGVLLAELTAFCYIFGKQKIKPKALSRTARGLILMGIAINLLAKPIKDLGAMDPNELTQGLLAMAFALGGFTLVAKAFTKIKTKGLVEAGKAMVIMAAAMNLLVLPISALGKMNIKALGKGLGGMAVALIEIAGFTAVMGKIAESSGNIMKASAALLVMSIGIKIMAGALDQMGANAKAGQGLSVMFGSLLILAIAMTAMKDAVAGAAAMILAGTALAIMAPAIALLSSLPIIGVAAGMVALAGTLLIFGGLAKVLSPLTPVMLALTGALALLGVAVAGVGAGLMLMVAAFLMATGPITKGAQKLAEAIPIVAAGIGEGIIAMVKAIGDSVVEVKRTFFKIVTSILEVLRSIIPDLVVTGLQLLMALLSGIDQNIGQITTTALSIISKFILGLSEGLPQIVDAGFNLIISLLNSMANAISKNGDRLANALANVLLAALGAIVGLIPGFGKKGKAMIDEWRKGFEDKSSKSKLDKTSKKIATDTEKNMKVKDKYQDGRNITKGLEGGLASYLPTLRTTAKKIADIVDSTVRKRNEIKSPSRRLARTGRYLMMGLINGLDSLTGTYQRKADSISTVMISSATRSANAVNDIMASSFSNGFDLNNSINKAIDVSFSMDKFTDRNAELNRNLAALTKSLDGVTDTMNSREMVTNVRVDGADDPLLFADKLVRGMRLNARSM